MPIRAYTSSDKSACLAIFDSNRPKFFAEGERQEFVDWLDQPGRDAYIVLEVEKRIVACGGIFYDPTNDTVGLAWGMVHAEFHRQGYGSELTQYRLALLSSQYPNQEQRIETSQHTMGFYARLGFEVRRVVANGFGEGLDKYEMARISSKA